MKGIETRRNKNGFTVVSVHWSANPDKTPEFIEKAKQGLPPYKADQEYELSWITGQGDPVYPGFKKELHTGWLEQSPKYEVVRGWDFGRRRPACIWLQDRRDLGQIWVLVEFLGKDLHFSQFIQEVLKISNEKFEGASFIDCCDPYGGVQRGDKSEFDNIQMLSAYGIYPLYCRTRIETRVKKLEKLLDPMFNRGKPGIMFDKSCKLLIAGLNGGLVLDKKDKPKKDKKYEDVHEGLCYAIDNIKDLFLWDGVGEEDREENIRYSPIGRPLT